MINSLYRFYDGLVEHDNLKNEHFDYINAWMDLLHEKRYFDTTQGMAVLEIRKVDSNKQDN
jgi:hypothetical protein